MQIPHNNGWSVIDMSKRLRCCRFRRCPRLKFQSHDGGREAEELNRTLDQTDDFLNTPNMIVNSRFHCWRNSKRRMNLSEVTACRRCISTSAHSRAGALLALVSVCPNCVATRFSVWLIVEMSPQRLLQMMMRIRRRLSSLS